jgi:hypothetical protein
MNTLVNKRACGTCEPGLRICMRRLVVGEVGAPATEVAVPHLGASGTWPGVAPWTLARPSFAARTDGNRVASGVFVLARKTTEAVAARSRSTVPYFCLSTAHRQYVHLMYLACSLRGWA